MLPREGIFHAAAIAGACASMKKLFVAIGLALALNGSAMAGFTEGANAYNARNYDVALKEITPLAKAGNADAQHLLGLMYYMIADAVTIIGTQDIVFGSIDR